MPCASFSRKAHSSIHRAHKSARFQAALGKMNCEVGALLIEAGLPMAKAARTVIAASSMGRLDVLHWLVGRGVDLDAAYPNFGVPRERGMYAAEKAGTKEVVRYLRGELDLGPAPTEPPLPRAAGEAHADVVQLLLQRGALPNGHDGKCWHPLEAAVMSGDPEVVSLLIAAGANVKAKPATGGVMTSRVRVSPTARYLSLLGAVIHKP